MSAPQSISIIGAGLAGSMLAIFLAKRGYNIDLYEQRPDLRLASVDEGRSINLALSARGLHALNEIGLGAQVTKSIVPMKSRALHNLGQETTYQPFGRNDTEYLGAISRTQLNNDLLNAAESFSTIKIYFNHSLKDVDTNNNLLTVQEKTTNKVLIKKFDVLFGADGASSVTRQILAEKKHLHFTKNYLDYGYKELMIPAQYAQKFEPHALHIWARRLLLMIANPNVDGSFTCTLFLPHQGNISFESLKKESDVKQFFQQYFPDAVTCMPTLLHDFFTNPVGQMATIKCEPWYFQNKVLLLGDAAHGIVPFFAQGMNSAFEDCSIINRLVDQYPNDWHILFEQFFISRKPNTDAISEMAMDNYYEIRDNVIDPHFLLRKEVERALMKRYPDTYISKHVMVMFERVPYQFAQLCGTLQQQLLDRICKEITDIKEIDWSSVNPLIAAYASAISREIL